MRALVLTLLVGVCWAGEGFEIKPITEKSLGVWEDGRPVLVYNHGTISKQGVAARYNRACYIHPLYGVDGETITEDFATDHRHHRGVYREGDALLYVNRGVGVAGPAIRLNCSREIATVQLRAIE